MNLVRTILQLVRRPAVLAGAGAGFSLTTIWIMLAASNNSSGGLARFVVLPILAGSALLVAGQSWLSGMSEERAGAHCGSCGYDQRGLPSSTVWCPECGADPLASGPYQTRWLFVLVIPAWSMMLVGVLSVIVATFYFLMWQSGALGVI